MSAIIPFKFDAHALRVQIDDVGLPWFNANDVCSALEFTNPHKAIADHVDADDLTKREVIDTLGRQQRANFINESGLYALILGSTKETAKRFKRWVTSEVLPAIRKTGGYSVPSTQSALPAPTHDRVSAILLIGEAIAKVPGVKTGIAMAATLTCIQENTGLTVETLRRTLPAAADPICSLNATQLGKLLGRSAKGIRYVAASLTPRLAVVVSDDRTVDVIPVLRPRVRRSAIEAWIAKLEASSVENYHEPIGWLDKHRFYLDQAQCDRVNALQRKLGSEPRDVGEIRVLRAEFLPDPLCTAEYIEPEAGT